MKGLQKQQRKWQGRSGYPGGDLVSLVRSLLSWELSPLHSTGVSGGSASALPNARLCSGSPRLWSQALSHPWTLSQLWLLPP